VSGGQQTGKGLGWNTIARTSQRAAGRWGTIFGGNLLGRISNWVQPVFDVDRPRYDDVGGSQFGLSGGTDGAIAEFPAVEFASFENDWELHEFDAIWLQSATHGGQNQTDRQLHIVTPRLAFPYQPVANNIVGPFGPQMSLTYQLSQGTVRSLAGTNPNPYPFGNGLVVSRVSARDNLNITSDVKAPAFTRTYVSSGGVENRIVGIDAKTLGRKFSPPLRVPANRSIVWQLIGPVADFTPYAVTLEVSILYNELASFDPPDTGQ